MTVLFLFPYDGCDSSVECYSCVQVAFDHDSYDDGSYRDKIKLGNDDLSFEQSCFAYGEGSTPLLLLISSGSGRSIAYFFLG